MRVVLLLLIAVVACMAAMPSTPVGEIVHEIPDSIPSFQVAAATPNMACTYTDATSKTTWDLSSLTKTTGDYKGTDGTYDYKMNVCAKSNAGSGCTDKNYAICQFSQGSGTFVASLGSFDTAPTWSLITIPPNPPEPYTNGLQYTLTNGDICWIAGRQQTRTAQVVFRCSTTTEETLGIVEDQTTCTFTITLKAKIACPGSGPDPPGPTPTPGGGGGSSGLSGGSVFLILVFSAIPVYIGLGCLYGYKKKQAAGIEAFPNIGFWRDLPGLVKDGCRFTYYLIRSGCKSGKAEQYDAL